MVVTLSVAQLPICEMLHYYSEMESNSSFYMRASDTTITSWIKHKKPNIQNKNHVRQQTVIILSKNKQVLRTKISLLFQNCHCYNHCAEAQKAEPKPTAGIGDEYFAGKINLYVQVLPSCNMLQY